MVGKSGYISVLIEIDTPAGIATGVTIPGLYSAMLNTHKPILATIKVKSTETTTNCWITYSISPRTTVVNTSGIIYGELTKISISDNDVIKMGD